MYLCICISVKWKLFLWDVLCVFVFMFLTLFWSSCHGDRLRKRRVNLLYLSFIYAIIFFFGFNMNSTPYFLVYFVGIYHFFTIFYRVIKTKYKTNIWAIVIRSFFKDSYEKIFEDYGFYFFTVVSFNFA